MNILYVVPYVPNRIRVRSFQLLNSMLRRGHQVTLATLWESDAEHGDLDALRADGLRLLAFPLTRGRVWRNLLDAGVRTLPLQARYSWQPTLAAALTQELAAGAVDVVHVEHLRGSEYGLAALNLRPRCDKPYPVVWDSVDCISHLFAQAARQSHSLKGRTMARVELARTRRRESWLVNQFDTTIVTSTTDRAALQTLGESSGRGRSRATPSVEVVGNGVDLDYFVPGDKRPADMPPRLVFSGKMSYHANVTAAVHLGRRDHAAGVGPASGRRDLDRGQDPAAAVTCAGDDGRAWEEHTPLPPRRGGDRHGGRPAPLPATGDGGRGAAGLRRGHPEQGAGGHGVQRTGGRFIPGDGCAGARAGLRPARRRHPCGLRRRRAHAAGRKGFARRRWRPRVGRTSSATIRGARRWHIWKNSTAGSDGRHHAAGARPVTRQELAGTV
ncbi:MAG: glycosyltransferase [Caldilineaceae bacterium]